MEGVLTTSFYKLPPQPPQSPHFEVSNSYISLGDYNLNYLDHKYQLIAIYMKKWGKTKHIPHLPHWGKYWGIKWGIYTFLKNMKIFYGKQQKLNLSKLNHEFIIKTTW